MNEAALKSPPARSGSETRRKQQRITFRLSPGEQAEIEAAADRAGLTLGSYVRARVLAQPTTRAVRRPPANKAALARLLGEAGRIGSNVNQMARQLNSGRDAAALADLAAMRRALWHIRDALLLELGMKASTEQHFVTVEPA